MPEISIVDTKNIIRAVKLKYGRDLGSFPLNSLRYKLDRIIRDYHFKYPDVLITRIIEDTILYDEIMDNIYLSDFELFRDPEIWNAFRKKTFPYLLDKFGQIDLLIPFCNNGFELYSLMIFLEETSFLENTTITVSFNSNASPEVVKSCKKKIKPKDIGLDNFRNLFPDGDKNKYFSLKEGQYTFKKEKLKGIEYIVKSLYTMDDKRKFNMILFRDRCIHFNQTTQNLILEKLSKLLGKNGLLVMGYRETPGRLIKKTGIFQAMDDSNRIYKKII